MKGNYQTPPVKFFFLLAVRKVGNKSYDPGPEYSGSGYFFLPLLCQVSFLTELMLGFAPILKI